MTGCGMTRTEIPNAQMLRINLLITSFAVPAFVICLWAASTFRAEAQRPTPADNPNQCRENYAQEREDCRESFKRSTPEYDRCMAVASHKYNWCVSTAGLGGSGARY